MEIPWEELISKKIGRLFPDEKFEDIMAILDDYGTRDFERERRRVQLAILKLSKGNMVRLQKYVAVAKGDYRDVLAWAEYPAEMRRSVSEMSKMPESDSKRIRGSDKKQYLDWLQSDDDE